MQDTAHASDEDDVVHIPPDRPGFDNAQAALSRPPLDQHYADVNSNPRRYKVLVACLVLFTMLFSWLVYTGFTQNDPWEATKCRMAYMSPGYLRLDGLNATHSRLAGKYSLWLYREQGWDLSNKPHGVPVLFAPGNAGSYRQVRSLAAAAARQYYSSPGKPRDHLLAAHHQELDFFAADFNEDFSAFHAGTLKEQAEYLADCIKYIKSLYNDQGDAAPTSVIVLAHSMGGIAARYMFLQEGFQPTSVRTVITLSTPHLIPPATFDRGVERIYRGINNYWRSSYAASPNPLNETLWVSIAGGVADTMISSDYADLSSLVPPSHGFSVMTTSIPTLFSPVDHQAMMWCDQLRQQVISALLQSTDAKRNDRVRALNERLAIFQKHLLTGIEIQPDIVTLIGEATFNLEGAQQVDGQLALGSDELVETGLYSLRLPDGASPRMHVTIAGSGVTIQYFACQGLSERQCHAVEAPQLVRIPSDSSNPSEPAHKQSLPVAFSDLEMPQSATHCLLKISKESGSIVQALFQVAVREVHTSLLGMYLLGWEHTSESTLGSASGTIFRFPRLDTSLIVFALDMVADASGSQFRLLVRVSSGGTFESHFFSGNVNKASIHLHSGAPYVPPIRSSSSGLLLQYWHDPACPVKISLAVNRRASLGTIVTRYRSIVASWPIFILLGTMRYLLVPPHTSGRIPVILTVGKSLRAFLLLEGTGWLAIVLAIGIVQAFLLHVHLLPEMASAVLLGTRHLLLLGLAPAFLAVVATAVFLSHVLLNGIVASLAFVYKTTTGRPGPANDVREERSQTRIIAFMLLSLFVLFFAPHQFAILSLFLMQAATTIRAYAKPPSTGRSAKEANYAVLLMLLWLLPQNGAILIVWLRNLQAGWWRPFPSDHNIFAILGSLLLVEHSASGKDLKMPTTRWVVSVTDYFLTVAMFAVLLWGGRYVFVVGEIVNIWFLWLALLQYDSVRKYL